MTYPSSWPNRSYSRPDAVVSRITEEQKHALYERRITTRDLAKILGVRETYLSSLFPYKEESIEKARKSLLYIRREFRKEHARRVISGELTINKASEIARMPYRNMARLVQKLKKEASQ